MPGKCESGAGVCPESASRLAIPVTGCARRGRQAQEHAAVWPYAETLTIEFADEPMAQYRVRYQPDKAHLLAVEAPLLFETPYQSAQLSLWELSDAEWLKVVRRPPYAPRKPRRDVLEQAALFG